MRDRRAIQVVVVLPVQVDRRDQVETMVVREARLDRVALEERPEPGV
jgi:hypothetical protein